MLTSCTSASEWYYEGWELYICDKRIIPLIVGETEKATEKAEGKPSEVKRMYKRCKEAVRVKSVKSEVLKLDFCLNARTYVVAGNYSVFI